MNKCNSTSKNNITDTEKFLIELIKCIKGNKINKKSKQISAYSLILKKYV